MPQICSLDRLMNVVSRLEDVDESCDSGDVLGTMRRMTLTEFQDEKDCALLEIDLILQELPQRVGCYLRLIDLLRKWEPDVEAQLDRDRWDFVAKDESGECLKKLAKIKSPPGND